jgi:hypothetical protein
MPTVAHPAAATVTSGSSAAELLVGGGVVHHHGRRSAHCWLCVRWLCVRRYPRREDRRNAGTVGHRGCCRCRRRCAGVARSRSGRRVAMSRGSKPQALRGLNRFLDRRDSRRERRCLAAARVEARVATKRRAAAATHIRRRLPVHPAFPPTAIASPTFCGCGHRCRPFQRHSQQRRLRCCSARSGWQLARHHRCRGGKHRLGKLVAVLPRVGDRWGGVSAFPPHLAPLALT